MEVIVAGPRDLQVSTSKIYSTMYKAGYNPTCIVHGGCRGVDTCAQQYADDLGIPAICFPAEWVKYGKGAGPWRNMEMASIADAALIFVHKDRPVTPGTGNMIAEAVRANIPVYVEEV